VTGSGSRKPYPTSSTLSQHDRLKWSIEGGKVKVERKGDDGGVYVEYKLEVDGITGTDEGECECVWGTVGGGRWLVLITECDREEGGGVGWGGGVYDRVKSLHVVRIKGEEREEDLEGIREVLKATSWYVGRGERGRIGGEKDNGEGWFWNRENLGAVIGGTIKDDRRRNILSMYHVRSSRCGVTSPSSSSTPNDLLFNLTTVRSPMRAGTRYTRRGGDEEGWVANEAETRFQAERGGERFTFYTVRGRWAREAGGVGM